jgi:hypothetical protein
VHLPVVRQCVTAAAHADQRPHPGGVEPFPVGVFHQERWHGPEQLVVAGQSPLDFEQVLGDREPFLVQRGPGLGDQVVRRAGQRGTAPQRQRLAVASLGQFLVSARGRDASAGRQPAKIGDVETSAGQTQFVAAGPGQDQVPLR